MDTDWQAVRNPQTQSSSRCGASVTGPVLPSMKQKRKSAWMVDRLKDCNLQLHCQVQLSQHCSLWCRPSSASAREPSGAEISAASFGRTARTDRNLRKTRRIGEGAEMVCKAQKRTLHHSRSQFFEGSPAAGGQTRSSNGRRSCRLDRVVKQFSSGAKQSLQGPAVFR